MTDVATALIGPLAGPECRRALGRGWLTVVRSVAGGLALAVALTVLWWAWISLQADPGYQPYWAMRSGLGVIEGIALAIALVMGPALTAGSLAGEKERGSLGLLLTTRVNAFEIVAGRLAGKFGQAAMMILAVAPAIVLPAALGRVRLATTLALIAFPMAIAFGGAGISSAASAASRRGRDALLGVYLVLFLFLIAPGLGASIGPIPWLSALNPFGAIEPMTWEDDLGPALRASAVWLAMGLGGVAFASWRLRTSCLRQTDGARKAGKRRWLKVPPVGDRPMLWKELFIERVGSLGRAGRWIGASIVGLLALSGLVLTAGLLLGSDRMLDLGFSGVYGWTGTFVARSSVPLMCLIQCAIGLRAAVTIASERERGTWDGLLTSPLSGREIVVGKLWGSLFALRWLILAAAFAWAIAWIGGFLDWPGALMLLCHTLFVGAFMAALGVRSSLSTATATKAMSITVGFWLLAYGGSFFAAGAASAIWILLGLLAWGIGAALQILDPNTFPRFILTSSGFVFLIALVAFFLILTLLIVSEARLRFDRIAGRLSGGEVEIAVDRLFHGRPMAPAPAEPKVAPAHSQAV